MSSINRIAHFYIMKNISYDRTNLKPQILIVGEYLLNFHPGANHDIEKYLEENGFEIIEARMTDVIRKTYFYQDSQIREYHLNKPMDQKIWFRTADMFFDLAHSLTDSIAKGIPLYKPAIRMDDLVKDSDPIIHHTFDAGEGVLYSRRDHSSRKTWMQIFLDLTAIWMPAKPCCWKRYF